MNFAIITQQLVSGMGSSLMIFVLTLLFSMPLGLLVAFGRMSKIKPLQAVIKVFIAILRGTPLMLQLLVVNFASLLSGSVFLCPDGTASLRLSSAFLLTMQHILRKFTVPVSNPSPRDNMRRHPFWGIIKTRPFSASFSRRW